MYTIEGAWCESTCALPTAPLAQALGLGSGTCETQGFANYEHDVEADVFVPESSTIESHGTFQIENGQTAEQCNMHYEVKDGICECFCVGAATGENQDQPPKLETKTQTQEGKCEDNGYAKYVGKKSMKVYTASTA